MVGQSGAEVACEGRGSPGPQSPPLPCVPPSLAAPLAFFTLLTLLTAEFVTAGLVIPVKGRLA